MNKEEYKRLIIEIVEEIDNVEVLKKIYSFANKYYKALKHMAE